MRSDHNAVGKQLTGVVEQDDAVAEKAPALLGVGGDGVRGFAVSRLRRGTLRSVGAGIHEFFHIF